MRTYLSPIGYNSTSVTRPVLSNGIDTGDTIVLLRPDTGDDARASEAIADVERLVTEIEPDITLETTRIPHEDFGKAVLRCSDLIRAAKDQRIVTLGGGARDILVPFVVAAISHVQLLDAALFFSDIDGTVVEWSLPQLTACVQQTVLETLREIPSESEGISIPELTERTNRSKSTVTRHVAQLADCEAVESWTTGKTKYVRRTLTGELLLRTNR